MTIHRGIVLCMITLTMSDFVKADEFTITPLGPNATTPYQIENVVTRDEGLDSYFHPQKPGIPGILIFKFNLEGRKGIRNASLRAAGSCFFMFDKDASMMVEISKDLTTWHTLYELKGGNDLVQNDETFDITSSVLRAHHVFVKITMLSSTVSRVSSISAQFLRSTDELTEPQSNFLLKLSSRRKVFSNRQ